MSLTRKQTGKLILPLLLLFTALQGFSQSKGFIIQENGTHRNGFINFNHRNPGEVSFSYMRGGTPRKYAVDELPGFGFKDSTIYVSKAIQLNGKPQRLFVEVIGDSTFFYLQRDQVFFKNTEPLEQINKEDLLPYLQSLTNASDGWKQELHLFRLKRNPIKYFARHHAAGKSPTVLFMSAGAFSGFNRSTLSTGGTSINAAQPGSMEATSENISAGVFAEIPVWLLSNLSLQAQGSYGKMRFNNTITSSNTRYDAKVNLDFARLSLMPKYTLSSSRLRFFAHAGPSVLYILKSDSQALKTLTKEDNVWLTFVPGVPVSKRTMLGFEAGAGASFFYLPQHYLSLGVSQAKAYGKHFNISNQSVTVSINL